jgi:tetratricopeptide (TPR) repeat protein
MARLFYERVLERVPGNFDARSGLGKALLQAASAANGDTALWMSAITQIEAARSLSPADSAVSRLLAEAWIVRGRTLLDVRDSAAAMDAFKRAVEVDGYSSGALNLYGALAFAMSNDTLAEKLFKRALALDTTQAAGWFNLGAVFWGRGDAVMARHFWDEALNRSPRDREIALWREKAQKIIGPDAKAGMRR